MLPLQDLMNISALGIVELFMLGLFAGGIGALTGIGGGLIITPVLTLIAGVPIHQAIGTSLCCVIATSSGAAASYIEQHFSDIRLGMTLELATTSGAILGAFIAAMISREALAILFSVLMVYAAVTMLRKTWRQDSATPEDCTHYSVKKLPLGMAGSAGAGMLSGLLGIGGGPMKVPIMYLVMGIPFKVASATSNFMIGVTAAASAFIYYARGDVRLWSTAPAAIGSFAGAALGTHVMRHTSTRWLVLLLSVIMLYLAVMMIWRSLHGGLPS